MPLRVLLRAGRCRSLCIIDEFGKGTLASDGIGLLCAALQHFTDRSPLPPKVIACTHFSEILHGGFIRKCALPDESRQRCISHAD